MFELTTGEWRNVGQALSGIATTLGLLVGGWWAYRRFRTTPDSRPKMDVSFEVEWQEQQSSLVLLKVRVAVANTGGKKRTLSALTLDGWSRIGCWYWSSDEPEPASGDLNVIQWSARPVVAQRLLASDVMLRQADEWDQHLVFVLPSLAAAVRLKTQLYFDGGKDDVVASCVSLRPNSEVRD